MVIGPGSHKDLQGYVLRVERSEPVAHLLPGRIQILIQQSFRRHNESRRAETALNAAVRDPCLLQRMQVRRDPDSFDGLDFRIFRHPAHFHDTGTYRFSVKQYRAGPALTGPAADLHARQSQTAQNIRQFFFFRVRMNHAKDPVNIVIRFL